MKGRGLPVLFSFSSSLFTFLIEEYKLVLFPIKSIRASSVVATNWTAQILFATELDVAGLLSVIVFSHGYRKRYYVSKMNEWLLIINNCYNIQVEIGGGGGESYANFEKGALACAVFLYEYPIPK